MALRVENGIDFAGDFLIFLGVSTMVCLSVAALFLLAVLASAQNKGSGFMIIVFPSYSYDSCHANDYYRGRHHGFHCYALIDMAFFILIGLIASGIVIGLALNMGFPSIALGLGIGWCAAFSIVLLGLFTRSMAKAIQAGNDVPVARVSQGGIFAANSSEYAEPVMAVPVNERTYTA